jgi:hypothetical protein
MKQGMSLQEMAARVQHNAENRQDYVVPVSNMEFGVNAQKNGIEFYSGVPSHGGIGGTINDHALKQLTTELNIPAKFVDVLRAEDPEFLPEVMNRRAHKSSSQRMLRTIDGRLVGAVSPSFSRSFDNDTILKAILPEIMGNPDYIVESCNVSDTLMQMKVVTPRLQGEVVVGDVVQGGIAARNSDVGVSRALINEFIKRLVCLNGMSRSQSIEAYKRIHRGSRNPMGILYAPETVAADQEAIALEMRDTIRHLLSAERFRQTIETMQDAHALKIEAKDLDKKVQALGKIVGFNQTEGDLIMQRLIEGADLSQYGMMNAVTNIANDTEDYDRASELEAMGGKVIELTPRQWNSVKEAA